MDNNSTTDKLPDKHATLLIIEMGQPVQTYALKGDAVMGRKCENCNNEITLSSGIVSRNHGEFIYEDVEGIFYYRDNNSLNGTFYNGVKLEQLNDKGTRAVRLSDGDILRIDCENLNNPRTDAVVIIFSTSFSCDEKWIRCSLEGRSVVTIGRGALSDIRLPDFLASRSHAKLILSDNTWSIENNSLRGVAVNKRSIIKQQKLNLFDVIDIANTTMLYLGNEVIYNEYFRKTDPDSRGVRTVLMSVDIDSVTDTVSNSTVLKDIELDIDAGDLILVSDSTGKGSAALFKALCGTDPDAVVNGSVLFDNMDLYDNHNFLKHKICIESDLENIKGSSAVYDILKSFIDSNEYFDEEIINRLNEMIDAFDLSDIVDSHYSGLSYGLKMRVSIAARAVSGCEVFIVDESCSDHTEDVCADIISNLRVCCDSGAAVIAAINCPDSLENLVTKILIFDKNKEGGTPHPAYYGNTESAYSFFGVNKLSGIIGAAI